MRNTEPDSTARRSPARTHSPESESLTLGGKKTRRTRGRSGPKPAKHGNIIGIVTATDEPLSGPAAAGRAVGLRGSGEAAGGEHGPRLGGSVNSRPRYVVTKPAGWCDHIGVSCPVRRRPLHAHGKASERSCALSRQLADRHTGLTTRKRESTEPGWATGCGRV